MQVLELIKGLIMKACRFIFNTDYVTSQNDKDIDISVAIPSTFTVAAGVQQIFKTTVTLAGSASKDYRCYFTSTAFNYAVTGAFECQIQFGSDNLYAVVQREKDKFTLAVYNIADTSSHTYSGTSQVITAHIQTFVDPFQL